MRLNYASFEEARKHFKWSERWEVFSRPREQLNIAYECVERHPRDKTAIRLQRADGRRELYTFGELSVQSSRFANMLARLGIGTGDRVAIVLEPSFEYYTSFYGTVKRGSVAVPCYSLLGPDGLDYRLRTSGAKVAIIGREGAKKVSPGAVEHVVIAEELMDRLSKERDEYEPATSGDTLAVIQFSSGTTGQPKQVLYQHEAMSVTAVFARFWLGLRDEDVYLCTSSPAWGHGIWYGTVAPLIYGNGIGAYSGKFDPRVCLEAMEAFKVTVMSAIPRVYKMISEANGLDRYRLELKSLTYTGAEISKELVGFFREKYGLFIRSTYGNTEIGPVVLDYAFDDWLPRPGSAGKPIFGVKLAVLDDNKKELPAGEVGNLAVWRNGGWRYLGDFGRVDEDGHVYPLGRSDDVIKSSGYRIGPFEIEHAIEKHPAIAKSAVVGIPDEERGEIVKAFVMLRSGYRESPELRKELQIFVKGRLSMHEYPKEIEFVENLPETPDGKVQRKVLKELERRRWNERAGQA